jgi:hypothetical protein
MSPKWSFSGRISQVYQPFLAEMDTISAVSVFGTHGPYH